MQQWVTKLDEELEKRLASGGGIGGIQAWTPALEGRKEVDVDYTMVCCIVRNTKKIDTNRNFTKNKGHRCSGTWRPAPDPHNYS